MYRFLFQLNITTLYENNKEIKKGGRELFFPTVFNYVCRIQPYDPL